MSTRVSIAEAKRGFSELLKQARKEPMVVTRRGQPDGVILPFAEYERPRRLLGYSSMVRLSSDLMEAGVKAAELYEASRSELEGRPWS